MIAIGWTSNYFSAIVCQLMLKSMDALLMDAKKLGPVPAAVLA
jgi:hypothetical protein